ncbi:MAG TPA: hypothetical protein ENN69_04690, partial [Spirochaetia bacterium]|nr:hypothetical protein [Spirochaetia bacterium]
LYNPAAAGLEQRTRLEANYMALIGSDSDPGWGHVVNLGVSLPTNFGVLSFTGNFTSSPLDSSNLGTVGGFHAAFSKDLFPNFLVGVGVGAVLGEQSGESDWGLSADLGITHLLGDVLFLKDFTWSAAMRGLGKGYAPTSANDYFPQAFTPAAGVSFKFVKTEDFSWGLAADLSFPAFQNLLLYAATDFDLFKFLTVRASFRMDVAELADGVERFPVAFGLSFNFTIDLAQEEGFLKDQGWTKNDIKVHVAGGPLQDNSFAAGVGLNAALGMVDKNPPHIKIDNPPSAFLPDDATEKDKDTVYISPNLDGVQDDMALPISITDERYIKGYRLVIKDKAGKVVRTIENKENRSENIDLDNVVNRLLYVKSGVQVPSKLVWDGRNDTGALVPDGEYSYSLEAWDDNDNRITTNPKTVVVDKTEPKADVKASYTLFSPNGDGNKDTLPLTISSSAEDGWKGAITNAEGKTIKTFDWKGAAPSSVSWDGTDDNGQPVKDGVYTFSLAATDRAGNKGSETLDNIIINTQATPIFITVDTGVFSPNGDGIAENVTFQIILGTTTGIKSWNLEILHEKEGAVRTISGGADVPDTVTWNGKTDDNSVAPEGLYTGRLNVEYTKGDKPVETSRQFRLDVSGPAAEITLSPEPFSPDNDGVEDELTIASQVSDPSGISTWKMVITDPVGHPFMHFSGEGTPSAKIIWNGISESGELVQAASDYKLTLSIEDTVGNKSSLEKTIMVDVLVIRDGDKLYIRVPSITFKPNTADYRDVAKEALEKNLWTLSRLARIFKKYKNYQIQIEGHAVSVYWRDPARSQREQVEELIPLSKKRAEAIKQALVDQGIEANRISTVGVGASRPLFPFSDEENLWKNRRVEFILIK